MTRPIGVAVIGAGMAGRSHAAGYRTAPTLYGPGLPEVRLVAVADANEALAADTARRYGYQRSESSWQAVAAADDGAESRPFFALLAVRLDTPRSGAAPSYPGRLKRFKS